MFRSLPFVAAGYRVEATESACRNDRNIGLVGEAADCRRSARFRAPDPLQYGSAGSEWPFNYVGSVVVGCVGESWD